MAAPDPAQLRAELTSDPAKVGYSAALAARNDVALAAALNSRAGPGATPVNESKVSRDDFLIGLRPALLALPGKDDATQRKWDRILGTVHSADAVTIDAMTIALLSAAVADGLLTQTQSLAIYQRAGSRAESLWGAGVVVPVDQVSDALNAKG